MNPWDSTDEQAKAVYEEMEGHLLTKEIADIGLRLHGLRTMWERIAPTESNERKVAVAVRLARAEQHYLELVAEADKLATK